MLDLTVRSAFAKGLPVTERRSAVRVARRERGIWQRRFWEHAIRDERDYAAHVDYVYINPLKHGWVTRVADWPYSTFHRYVRDGLYPPDWSGTDDFETGERNEMGISENRRAD